MRTLYLDCGMGAAGDMLAAALLELLPDRESFLQRLRQLGLPGVTVSAEPSVKCGITGTHFTVQVQEQEEDEHLHDHHQHHHHSDLQEIRAIVSGLPVSDWVKSNALAVYDALAAAESKVHGVPVEQIHFHEVGALDAVTDVTAVCLLLEALQVEEILASPVHVGSGTVRCAHGILPVPAPATAELLKGVPVYGGSIQSELCTPTGAALLKHFVSRFGDLPVMQVQNVGYGMGKKDFPRANCVRALLGERQEQAETVLELCCSVDDMTGEAVAFAMEQLLSHGALDAYTTAISMKKGRPGVQITVLCREVDREKFAGLLFRHTTTLGIREKTCARHVLRRRLETVSTPLGELRRKVSDGFGVHREKYEYEDLAKAAREQDLSLEEILRVL